MDVTNMDGDTLVATIRSNIEQLNQNVQNLEILGEKIGGSEDGETLREQIAEVTSVTNQLSKQTNVFMKKLVELSNDPQYVSTMKVHRVRLMDKLISVLNRLQVAQRNASAKEKESMKALAAQDQQVNQQIEQMDVDERQQLQMQHQKHLTEIRGRSEAMRQLDSEINDVTQIMKDLARIVHDQGDLVDSIEANVEHASLQVQQGATQVHQARIYNEKARQKKVIVLAFLITLILIIILVAYFFSK